MSAVNIYEAKTQLSKLVARAEAGEEIVISRNGRAAARLVPVDRRTSPRRPGALKGRVILRDDFDEFTADDERDWYGG